MRRALLLLAVTPLAIACQRPNEPPSPSSSADKTALAKDEKEHVVEQSIAWPSAASIDRGALDAMPSASSSLVARAPVPVLVPGEARLLGGGTLIVDTGFYSFTARLDGVTVTIQGTKLAHVYPDIAPIEGTDRVRGVKGFVTTNEGIEHASWQEHGASYALDVECEDPGDVRCAARDHGFLLSLADNLRFVGGAGAK